MEKINFVTLKRYFCGKCGKTTLHEENPKYEIRVCITCEKVTSRYPYRKIIQEYFVEIKDGK